MQFTFYFICCVVRATKFLDLPFIVNKKFIIKNFASYNVIKESVFSSFSLGKAWMSSLLLNTILDFLLLKYRIFMTTDQEFCHVYFTFYIFVLLSPTTLILLYKFTS